MTRQMTHAPAQDALPPLARVCLFLDFDGTLVPLAPTPDAIEVPGAVPDLLDRLHRATDGRVLIVSGREVAAIAGFLPGFAGDIAGGHGAEIRQGGTLRPHPLAGTDAAQALVSAIETAGEAEGFLVERKKTGAVLHYRETPDRADHARRIMEDILQDRPEFALHDAKMAWEARPKDADKGGIVARVMADHPPQIVPVMIGDDVTDEEAMQAARDRGGFGVKVGKGDTVADLRLPDPAAVARFLADWLDGGPR